MYFEYVLDWVNCLENIESRQDNHNKRVLEF